MKSERRSGFLSTLERFPRSVRHIILFGGLAVVGMFDFLTGRQLSFALFYLIPISLAAWTDGLRRGILASLLAGLIWFSVDVYSPPVREELLLPLWNTMVRTGTFLVVVFLISNLRKLNLNLESIVEDRTKELAQEVRERERMEVEAREVARKFQDLVENISEVYYVSDAAGRFLYASPNLFASGGYKEEDVLAKRYVRLIAPEDRRRVVDFYVHHASIGTIDTVCEFRALMRSGDRVWVEQTTRIVRDQQGHVVEYRNVVRDIRARKQAEERIGLLAHAVESSSDLISITDLEGRFLFVNKAFLEQYGYEESEIIGRTPFILQDPSQKQDLGEQVMEETRRGGPPERPSRAGWIGEMYNRKKNGVEFPVFLSTSRIQDANGNVIGFVRVARDIAERKRAEQALLAAETRFNKVLTTLGGNQTPRQTGSVESEHIRLDDLAEKINALSNSMQDGINHTLQFSSLASHELRTPLTIMRNELEDALDVGATKEHLHRTMVSVYDEILRMTRIVDDLLSLGSFEAGTLKLDTTCVKLKSLFEEFYEEAMYLSRERNISVVLASTPDVSLQVDVVKMRQVFFNLLDNALKNTPPQGRIRIEPVAESGKVLIRFSDTGKGIPSEQVAKLFDPFARLKESTAHSGSGFGLGLPLVRKIIEAHGGTITVQSALNEGTTFLIELPTVNQVKKSGNNSA